MTTTIAPFTPSYSTLHSPHSIYMAELKDLGIGSHADH